MPTPTPHVCLAIHAHARATPTHIWQVCMGTTELLILLVIVIISALFGSLLYVRAL